MERGATQDPEFSNWARQVANAATSPTLENLRLELTIVVYNEAGQATLSYKIHRCWVSDYQATSDLNAGANAIAIEQIKLEHEGWEVEGPTTELPELKVSPS